MPKEVEKTTFVDSPGSHPTDEFLSSYRQKLALEPGVPDVEEDDYLPGEPDDIEKRLAVLEAENQRLRNQETAAVSATRQQQINQALTDLTEAARYGDDDRVQKIRAYLDQLAGTVGQLPQASPGHWSNDVANLVMKWKSERTWLGRDAARMQAMQQVGANLDPARYPSASEYFQAVEDQIEVMVGAKGNGADGPRPRNGASPSMGSLNNAGGSSSPRGKVTSLRQLSAREREVASTMMRIGKLTEEQYLASYNSVRQSAEAHRKAVARTVLR